MPETRTVQTNIVDERCPVCKNGWMRPNGIVPSQGQYEHTCSACNYKQIYPIRYPYNI
ncbi:hypothetical protein KY334_04275 [Candidatus Woesearchaeota archaeon]|nr:hypothetical protein [Candidatus Woesearchaeota archaeon]